MASPSMLMKAFEEELKQGKWVRPFTFGIDPTYGVEVASKIGGPITTVNIGTPQAQIKVG